MPQTERKIKCRYCGWTTPVFIARKGKKPISGMSRLIEHVWDEHEDHFFEMQKRLLSETQVELPGDDDMREAVQLHGEYLQLRDAGK